MMDPSFTFTEIALCEQCIAEKIQGNSKSFLKRIVKADLHVFIENSCSMLVLQIDQLMFGINSEDQILYDCDSNYKLVFYLNSDRDNRWILKLSDNDELLRSILDQKCKFIDVKNIEKELCVEDAAKEEVMVPQLIDKDDIRDEIQPMTQQQLSPTSTEMKLIQASKKIGGVIKKAGTLIKDTALFLGNHLAERLEPAEPVRFSDTSMRLASQSSKATGKVLELTQQQVAKLFRFGMNKIKGIGDNLGPQTQKDSYNSIKQKVKTGLTIAYNLYDGYSEGVGEVIEGLGEGSKKVVGKKYGQDAANLTENVVQSAKNVYKVTKVPKDQAKKLLNPNTESQSEQ